MAQRAKELIAWSGKGLALLAEEGKKPTWLVVTIFPVILPVQASGMLITIKKPKNKNFK